MLLILTGDIQIGKTHWLEARIHELTDNDRCVYGVLAPGQWHTTPDGNYEKLGIDNVLLPGGSRVSFARACPSGWDFSPTAIKTVNEHFRTLSVAAGPVHGTAPGLLVVDELGYLELQNDEGLTEALALLDRGPTQLWSTALVVVRDRLADQACARLSPVWNKPLLIRPDEAGVQALQAALTS